MPERIQRKRIKGYRMPEGAIYVGRPTKWANPFRVGSNEELGEVANAELAVKLFRDWMHHPEGWLLPRPPELLSLRGRDLACWCLLDHPCHASVLLELANA